MMMMMTSELYVRNKKNVPNLYLWFKCIGKKIGQIFFHFHVDLKLNLCKLEIRLFRINKTTRERERVSTLNEQSKILSKKVTEYIVVGNGDDGETSRLSIERFSSTILKFRFRCFFCGWMMWSISLSRPLSCLSYTHTHIHIWRFVFN